MLQKDEIEAGNATEQRTFGHRPSATAKRTIIYTGKAVEIPVVRDGNV
jgi:hypothetical protein